MKKEVKAKGPKRNNAVGIKGRSGRKTKVQEIQRAIKDIKEKVTQEALMELANQKVYAALRACKTIRDIQALGLPISLKGITEKKELSGKVEIKQITGMKIAKE